VCVCFLVARITSSSLPANADVKNVWNVICTSLITLVNKIYLVLAHEEKYLNLIELLTLNSNV